jgi:hypothetical protein
MKILLIALTSLTIALQACTLSSSDERGDLSLEGTIFEGFSKITNSEDFDASQIEGAYYACRRTAQNAGQSEYACVLKLADGDSFDGAAFQESILVQYGNPDSAQSVEIKTARPPESSEDHFQFTLSSSIANQMTAIKSQAPVVLNSK